MDRSIISELAASRRPTVRNSGIESIHNSNVNTRKIRACVYILYTYYIRSTLIVIIYSTSTISANVFTSNFYLNSSLLTSRLPAPLFILFYLASSRCNSLPPYVSIAQVEGEGGGEDNASDTTYFTQCLHPCRVSVWSRIHVSVFVAGYSSAIEILPSSVVSGSWGEVENGRELYRTVLLYIYIYIGKLFLVFFFFFFYLFLGRNAT